MDTISTAKRVFIGILLLGLVAVGLVTTRFEFSFKRMLQSNFRERKQPEIMTFSSKQQPDDATQTPITEQGTKIPKVLSQGLPPGSGTFHKVTGADIWVYSVFYEPVRPGTLQSEIRAVGFGYLNVKFGKIICEVIDEDSVSQDFEATVRFAMDEHRWGKVNGSACFLEFSVPIDYQPRYVQFYMQTNETKSATDEYNFPILYRAPRQRRITVCYSVFHGGFDKGHLLVNAVEYNRLMGAEHFFIYIQKVGRNFQNVIDFYASKGLMTALEMPKFPSEYAWQNGQIISLNDCIQRNKGISEYVLLNDPDEFIVPLRHPNWLELIEFVKRKKLQSTSQKIGSISFLNSFYCFHPVYKKSWEYFKSTLNISKEEERLIRRDEVYIFFRHSHEKVYTYPSRSKTIHRPELVYEPGIHYAHKLLPNITYIAVNETIGFSAHFRSNGQEICRDDSKVKTYHRPYLNNLMQTQREMGAYLHNKNNTVL